MPTLPELDVARIRSYCEGRVPADLRDRMRLEVSVRGKSVTVFDCRPPWHPDISGWSRVPVAQMRYDHDARRWTLYWRDRNSRWHPYDLLDPGTVGQVLAELDEDPTSIFWG